MLNGELWETAAPGVEPSAAIAAEAPPAEVPPAEAPAAEAAPTAEIEGVASRRRQISTPITFSSSTRSLSSRRWSNDLPLLAPGHILIQLDSGSPWAG